VVLCRYWPPVHRAERCKRLYLCRRRARSAPAKPDPWSHDRTQLAAQSRAPTNWQPSSSSIASSPSSSFRRCGVRSPCLIDRQEHCYTASSHISRCDARVPLRRGRSATTRSPGLRVVHVQLRRSADFDRHFRISALNYLLNFMMMLGSGHRLSGERSACNPSMPHLRSHSAANRNCSQYQCSTIAR
jgi:hypothetical protein